MMAHRALRKGGSDNREVVADGHDDGGDENEYNNALVPERQRTFAAASSLGTLGDGDIESDSSDSSDDSEADRMFGPRIKSGTMPNAASTSSSASGDNESGRRLSVASCSGDTVESSVPPLPSTSSLAFDHHHRMYIGDEIDGELNLLRESTSAALRNSWAEVERLRSEGATLEDRIGGLRTRIEEARKEEERLMKAQPVGNRGGGGNGDERGSWPATDTRASDKLDSKSTSTDRNSSGVKKTVAGGLGPSPSTRESRRLDGILAAVGYEAGGDDRRPSGSEAPPPNTFPDRDGMPSRWRKREEEQEELYKTASLLRGGSGSSRSVGNDCGEIDFGGAENANEMPDLRRRREKIAEISRLETLVSERELEISVLEHTTVDLETETGSLQKEIEALRNERDSAREAAQPERNQLWKDVRRLNATNERMERRILETGVLLEERRIGGQLLRKELKEAREELYERRRERDAIRDELQQLRRSNTGSGAQQDDGGGGSTSRNANGGSDRDVVGESGCRDDEGGEGREGSGERRAPGGSRKFSSSVNSLFSTVSALTLDEVDDDSTCDDATGTGSRW